MALVEAVHVLCNEPDPNLLLGAYLDRPTDGTESHRYDILLMGWVVGREAPVERVLVQLNNATIASIPVQSERPDVAAIFPDVTHALMSGYQGLVNCFGLPAAFELHVSGVLPSGEHVLLATLWIRNTPYHAPLDISPCPLLVMSLGRAGSTIMMHYLMLHPAIAGYKEYPYELLYMTYMMHQFRLLTASSMGDPAAQHQILEKPKVLENPFANTDVWGNAISRLFSEAYLDNAVRYTRDQLTLFYGGLARAYGKPEAVCFAEKIVHAWPVQACLELFPQTRVIYLTRDFRDRYCSILAFNQKRGFNEFAVNEFAGDEVGYFEDTLTSYYTQRSALQSHPECALVIKYEDLVLDPRSTLTRIFAFLNIPLAPVEIDALVEKAGEENEKLAFHRTTDDPRRSIGRWKRDLTPAQIDQIHAVLGDLLVELGYES